MTIVLVGFVVGVCISFSGVGAGSLTTPLLVLVGGYDVGTAIGTDLLFSLGTKLTALVTHARAKTIDYAALARLALGGVPGALAGLLATGWMHAHLPITSVEHVLRVALAAVLFVAASAIAFTRTLVPDGSVDSSRMPTLPLVATGCIVGSLASLTSIGSGSLTLPLLMLVLSTAHVRRLVGTDVAFAVVLLVPALLGQWHFGNVNPQLGGLLLVGSVPGVLVGAPLAARIPERAFRVVLALVLAGVGVVLLR